MHLNLQRLGGEGQSWALSSVSCSSALLSTTCVVSRMTLVVHVAPAISDVATDRMKGLQTSRSCLDSCNASVPDPPATKLPGDVCGLTIRSTIWGLLGLSARRTFIKSSAPVLFMMPCESLRLDTPRPGPFSLFRRSNKTRQRHLRADSERQRDQVVPPRMRALS
ncbi:hypothetical protein BDZ89DRAFT_1070778 [Hymenopellis radicata]|nr:hypothetical protein BDZ89DRAFT_1070778 [Hymenopellis radicata]